MLWKKRKKKRRRKLDICLTRTKLKEEQKLTYVLLEQKLEFRKIPAQPAHKVFPEKHKEQMTHNLNRREKLNNLQ